LIPSFFQFYDIKGGKIQAVIFANAEKMRKEKDKEDFHHIFRLRHHLRRVESFQVDDWYYLDHLDLKRELKKLAQNEDNFDGIFLSFSSLRDDEEDREKFPWRRRKMDPDAIICQDGSEIPLMEVLQ